MKEFDNTQNDRLTDPQPGTGFMTPFFLPHSYVHSVCDLKAELLHEMGIDAVLLDVDCTLKRYRAEEVAPEVATWLNQLQEAGIGVCLVSNGGGPRIRRFADALRTPFVATALKPLPFGCRRAIRNMGFDRRRTAMIGDQLFADVWAGRLAGLTTILVDPIHPEEEPWFTRLKRRPERWIVDWLVPRPSERVAQERAAEDEAKSPQEHPGSAPDTPP